MVSRLNGTLELFNRQPSGLLQTVAIPLASRSTFTNATGAETDPANAPR
jgi:hypothetical protein